MTDYQQQATNAYRERIKQAVWAGEENESWDAAARTLYEAFQTIDSPDQQWVYETLPQNKKKAWRAAAFRMVDFLAHRLGATVLTAPPENFQDDERAILDGTAKSRPEPEKPRSRPRPITGRKFAQHLADIGVIQNLDNTARIVIDIRHDGGIVIHQEMLGDDRLLDVAMTLEGVKITHPDPSAEQIRTWLDEHPREFDAMTRRYDRAHGTTAWRKL